MSSSQSSLGQTIDTRENVPVPPGSPPPSAPATCLDQGSAMSENQAPYWNCNADIQQRVRSPTLQMSDACKLRHCMNVQCGRGYDGIPIQANGSCPRPQTMYYQSMGLPMRVQQNHHHHPGSGPSCHPHQPQPTLGPFPNLQTPHSPLERMMHSSSANQQIRSVVMNHYATNSGCLHHNGAPSSGPGYYQQSTSSAPGVPVNGSSYLEYNHHNHHHGPGMPTSGTSSGSYRMSAAAAAHHHKVMNPNHAAALAAYQNVYHQYTQYFHHQGMMHAYQNQQGGTSEYAMNQNIMPWGGIPMNGGPSMPHLQQASHQPPACLFPYMNRIGNAQPVPPYQSHHHRHHHHHNHNYSACHPPVVPNCMLPNQHHNHAQNRGDSSVLLNQSGNLESSKSETKSSSLSESMSSKDSVKELHNKKNRKGPAFKLGSSKISSTSSEKSSKAKMAKSLTRLRERQPRLVVGQKKKSLLNISGNSACRKHKSISKTSTVISGFVSCKHAAGSGTDSGASRVIKRSKMSPKKDSEDDVSETSASTTTSGRSDDEQSKHEEDLEQKENEFDNSCCLDETLDEEYVPTPEEMIEYLERLNTCSSLNLPLHQAYSVFQDNEMDKDSSGSDCSVDDCVDGVLHETECLNCLTWQQQQYDICPSRPPPGFEHLSRPAFPIELYDPSLLGSLIGSQMPRGSTHATSPDSYFEDVQEVLTSLTCCGKHVIDKIWNMKKTSAKLYEGVSSLDSGDCDWDTLDKAIRNVLDDWTEELYFRKKVQQILFGLNLHEVYGGCCKTSASEESSNISEKSTFGFTPLITREEQSQIRYFIDDSIL